MNNKLKKIKKKNVISPFKTVLYVGKKSRLFLGHAMPFVKTAVLRILVVSEIMI